LKPLAVALDMKIIRAKSLPMAEDARLSLKAFESWTIECPAGAMRHRQRINAEQEFASDDVSSGDVPACSSQGLNDGLPRSPSIKRSVPMSQCIFFLLLPSSSEFLFNGVGGFWIGHNISE